MARVRPVALSIAVCAIVALAGCTSATKEPEALPTALITTPAGSASPTETPAEAGGASSTPGSQSYTPTPDAEGMIDLEAVVGGDMADQPSKETIAEITKTVKGYVEAVAMEQWDDPDGPRQVKRKVWPYLSKDFLKVWESYNIDDIGDGNVDWQECYKVRCSDSIEYTSITWQPQFDFNKTTYVFEALYQVAQSEYGIDRYPRNATLQQKYLRVVHEDGKWLVKDDAPEFHEPNDPGA